MFFILFHPWAPLHKVALPLPCMTRVHAYPVLPAWYYLTLFSLGPELQTHAQVWTLSKDLSTVLGKSSFLNCMFRAIHIHNCVVGWPWLATRCPPSHSITPPLQLDGEKTGWKNLWLEKRTGRLLTSYHHGQKRLNLGTIDLIYCQLITE